MTASMFWTIALLVNSVGCGVALSMYQTKRAKPAAVYAWTFGIFGCSVALWASQFGG